jgi:hypothetical protein
VPVLHRGTIAGRRVTSGGEGRPSVGVSARRAPSLCGDVAEAAVAQCGAEFLHHLYGCPALVGVAHRAFPAYN